MLYEILDSREVDQSAGLLSDETIKLTGPLTSRKYPDSLRLVVYEDFSTNTVYRFLTNNFKLEALTIAELYRERWQIELFFKWIKQHLHIKHSMELPRMPCSHRYGLPSVTIFCLSLRRNIIC